MTKPGPGEGLAVDESTTFYGQCPRCKRLIAATVHLVGVQMCGPYLNVVCQCALPAIDVCLTNELGMSSEAVKAYRVEAFNPRTGAGT